MAIVLNFGKKPSCTVVKKIDEGHYEIVDYIDLTSNPFFSSAFQKFRKPYSLTSEDVAKALKEFFQEEKYIHEKFYVTIGGWDTIYHSDTIGEQELGGNDTKKMSREDILALLKTKVPNAIKEIFHDFEFCILGWGNYAEKAVTFSMIPSEYISAVTEGFLDSPFTLFGICPLCYGIYNALFFDRHKFCVVNTDDARALCNNFGLTVWAHSDEIFVSDTEEDEYLFYEFQRVYGIELDAKDSVILTIGNIQQFLRVSLDGQIRSLNQVGALGMIMPHVEEKALLQEEKKDFIKDVSDTFRKLLEEK